MKNGAGICTEKSRLASTSITSTSLVDNKCDDLDIMSFGGAIIFFSVTGNIIVVKARVFCYIYNMIYYHKVMCIEYYYVCYVKYIIFIFFYFIFQ